MHNERKAAVRIVDIFRFIVCHPPKSIDTLFYYKLYVNVKVNNNSFFLTFYMKDDTM